MAGRFFGAGNAPAAATAAESEDAAAIQTPPPSQVEKRLALVIGNTRYRAEPLSNAAADAALIGRILPALGFETMRIEDAGAEALRSGVIGFANTLALAGPGAVAFVYYAGHGIQVSDTSYLLPVDVTSAELAAAGDRAYIGRASQSGCADHRCVPDRTPRLPAALRQSDRGAGGRRASAGWHADRLFDSRRSKRRGW